MKTNGTVLLIMILAVLVVNSCNSNHEYLNESGRAAGVPKSYDLPFTQYVQQSRENIEDVISSIRFKTGKSPYLGDYTSNEVALMRGPFQIPESDEKICSDISQGGGKGFLLIHGLMDSPYLLKDIGESLHKAYPCSVIRAVLLPGHGTIAGDSLSMTHNDWLEITEYGAYSFEKMEEIQEVYIVGFSTGTALAIKHMVHSAYTKKIRGLVLISAAVQANTSLAFLSVPLSVFADWTNTYRERDGARYESFSFNAGAQFYKLTKDIISPKYALEIPTLMAVSSDDSTINPEKARDFFCKYTNPDKRLLLWYQSNSDASQKSPLCNDIEIVDVGSIEKNHKGNHYRYANYAHVSLSMTPDNSHYGVVGTYRNCKAFDKNNVFIEPNSDFALCQKGSKDTVFGEKNIASKKEKKKLGYDYWRRGTFNPDYDTLFDRIICLVDEDCSFLSSKL